MMVERIRQQLIQYKHRQPGHVNRLNYPSAFDHAHKLNQQTQTRIPKTTANVEHIPSNRTIPNEAGKYLIHRSIRPQPSGQLINVGKRISLTGVGHGDLADFIGVKPDFAFATLEDARGQALLQLQRHHLRRRR